MLLLEPESGPALERGAGVGTDVKASVGAGHNFDVWTGFLAGVGAVVRISFEAGVGVGVGVETGGCFASDWNNNSSQFGKFCHCKLQALQGGIGWLLHAVLIERRSRYAWTPIVVVLIVVEATFWEPVEIGSETGF